MTESYTASADLEKTNNEQPTPEFLWNEYDVDFIDVGQGIKIKALNFYFDIYRISVFKRSKWEINLWVWDNFTLQSGALYKGFNLGESHPTTLSEKKEAPIRTVLKNLGIAKKPSDARKLILDIGSKASEHEKEIDGVYYEEEIQFFDKIENPKYSNASSTMKKYLHIVDDAPYTIITAIAISNRMDGPPAWGFIVGVPSSGKNEIIERFSVDGKINKYVHPISSLTKNTLISGMEDNEDLIGRLNGKILAMKDFTAISSKDQKEVKEILGTLRDAYDGNVNNEYGSGVGSKHHKSKFTFISGVTPSIDSLGFVMSVLGERFIKVRIHGTSDEKYRSDVLDKVVNSLEFKNKEIKEYKKEVSNILLSLYEDFDPENLPIMDAHIIDLIKDCAEITALLRTAILRDFKGDVDNLPKPELAPRLLNSYMKLAYALAYVLDKKTVDIEVVSYVYRVALDTPDEIRTAVIRVMDFKGETKSEISEKLNLPGGTIEHTLEDLKIIGIISSYKPEVSEEEKYPEELFHLSDEKHIFSKIRFVQAVLDGLPDEQKHHLPFRADMIKGGEPESKNQSQTSGANTEVISPEVIAEAIKKVHENAQKTDITAETE